jgi:hypothetical protein
MKISKAYDPREGAPDISKGTNPFDNPGITPSKSIPMTPGEKASNDAKPHEHTKAQPFGKGGSGYTK